MKTMIRKSRLTSTRSDLQTRPKASTIKQARRQRGQTLLLNIKSILVPIDFSESSKRALAYAIPFAEQCGAKLTLLHVVEPPKSLSFVGSLPLGMEDDAIKAACKEQLDCLVEGQAIDPKLIEKTLVRRGRAFIEISDAARTLKVDLIIISTHGYTGVKHAFLGSTTERVVSHATCPVLVVRAK